MPRLRERANGEAPAYTIKSLPADERPRERLLKRGPGSLSDGELLAVILRTGLVGEMVTELATNLLEELGGFWGLANASVDQLQKRRGLKGAKVAQIKAAIEIGKRMAEARPSEERPQVASPDDAYRLVQFEMAGLEQEEMWLLLLDRSNTQLLPLRWPDGPGSELARCGAASCPTTRGLGPVASMASSSVLMC